MAVTTAQIIKFCARRNPSVENSRNDLPPVIPPAPDTWQHVSEPLARVLARLREGEP